MHIRVHVAMLIIVLVTTIAPVLAILCLSSKDSVLEPKVGPKLGLPTESIYTPIILGSSQDPLDTLVTVVMIIPVVVSITLIVTIILVVVRILVTITITLIVSMISTVAIILVAMKLLMVLAIVIIIVMIIRSELLCSYQLRVLAELNPPTDARVVGFKDAPGRAGAGVGASYLVIRAVNRQIDKDTSAYAYMYIDAYVYTYIYIYIFS